MMLFLPMLTKANNDPDIIFPVEGGATFIDDFGYARSGGRSHEANDLMAPKMTRILAAQSGVVTYAPNPEPSYGYMLTIKGDDGYTYNYVHINNDTPGTDDGMGGIENAYAPGVVKGARVTQGQHIAWVGDSGNAENIGSHLHFEIRLSDKTAINPYPFLIASLDKESAPEVEIVSEEAYSVNNVLLESPSINIDKDLSDNDSAVLNCETDSLIRIQSISSVYYCGADGKRYVFPNHQTYSSWYDNFDSVSVISLDDMSKISLGGNVTYRPGMKLLKIQTDPKVYAVEKNGTLRHLTSPELAAKYYGADWAKKIDDVPDTFFMDYNLGLPITS